MEDLGHGAAETAHAGGGRLSGESRWQRWQGRRVFLTGHTGFKGGWLALWLASWGAEVRGYGLHPCTTPNLFEAARVGLCLDDVRGDVRDGAELTKAMREFAPEVVFHLAAQPLVRASYADPLGTYETNVMGTAHVLESVRATESVQAVITVTTDKCYENREWQWGYRESDPLGGYDPYSSSKACAEMVSAAYRQSFFTAGVTRGRSVALATARAGNVIGGGDWSEDRLVPDLVKGFLAGVPVAIRRPDSIRPWQHVLEPLDGYLRLAERMLGGEGSGFANAYNFGPSDEDARPVQWVANRMASAWGPGASLVMDGTPQVHEAGYLKLDASRARADLGWLPKLRLGAAIDWSLLWYKAHAAGEDMQKLTLQQIQEYESLSA